MQSNSQQLEIREINDKTLWEEFLASVDVKEKTFLQSWNWGEFQANLGEKVFRLSIFEADNLKAVCLIIRVKAKRGTFLLIPHGPIVKGIDKAQAMQFLLPELKKIAKKEKCCFIRVAPIWSRGEENEKIFKDLGFKASPMHIHPELSWVLDLKRSEAELLADMRKTTRYLIKKGENDEDLQIIKSQDIKDIAIFNQLYQKTVARHDFTPFSLNYLEKEFISFAKDNQAVIFLAKYKNEYLAASVIIFWAGIGFYHQGASQQSKVPAAYLMQWQAISEAKRRGCSLYNFWGIADVTTEEELKNHPWRGLTLFKKGFSGEVIAYTKTQDYPITIRYWAVRAFEILRKKKRGF